MKLFLRKSDNLIIEDPRNVKTLKDIKAEYGKGEYIEDHIDFKREYYNVVNGKINKLNRAEHQIELDTIEEKRKTEMKIKLDAVRGKLGLTKTEMKHLIMAMKTLPDKDL